MKFRILFWLFFLFSGSMANAQTGLFINDSAGGVRVMKNTFLYIQGDLQVLSINSSPIRQLINGRVYLEGNLVCNDNIIFDKDSNTTLVPSTLQFVGTNDSYITGTVMPQLYRLNIDKSSGNVYINHNIEVHDTIEFIQGNGIIAQDKEVFLKYRQGSNTVTAHPWLLNERAASRFTGDGFVTTAISTQNLDYSSPGGFEDIANTGFYFSQEIRDSLYLRRGHIKQLYAGEGSIDRYFDVNFIIDTSNIPLFAPVGIKFLPDVDYSLMGVDTSRLRMYVSPTFSDATFVRGNDVRVDSTRRNLNDGSVFDNIADVVPVSPIYFRFTLGDTTCTNPPYSALPDSVIHLCSGETIDVSAMNQQMNGFNQVSYYWNDGSTAVDRTFSANASYTEYVVKLTDQRGCYTYDTLRIDPIAPNPSVNFNWTNVCLGDTSQFRDITTISSGSFSSAWNFGDGNTLPLAANDTIYHSYSTAAAYTATLTATSNYGCSASISHSVSVFNHPAANLVMSTDCFYDVISFNTSGSSGTTVPVVSAINSTAFYIDGIIQPSIGNTFTTPLGSFTNGNHSIDVVVQSGVGCADTLSDNFTIYAPDTAGFTASGFCLGDTVDIQNTSLISNTGVSYSWNLDDGMLSSDFEPVAVYSVPGIKVIQLVVETDAVCSDTFELAIEIFGTPSSDFSVGSVCLQQDLNLAPDVISGTNNYSWDFGNGNFATAAITSTQYVVSGNYDITLTVTDQNGCSIATEHNVQVLEGPAADFNALSVCEGNTTQFYNTSNGASGYQWNFGDFSSSALTSPSHTYAAEGGYVVSLIATDASGCTDTVTQTVTVFPLPSIPVGNVSTCGTSYVLNAQNPGSTYYWSPVNVTTQSLTVTQNGNYTVQVTDVNGCVNSATAAVILNSVVQPVLGPDLSVCGQAVLDAGYSGADFVWSTGDDTQTITVNTAGQYWVEVTDQNNCVGTDTINILNVYVFTEPDLGPDLNLCETVFPHTLNAGTYASYNWSTQESTPSISLTGTNSVWVEVTDVNGCSGRDTILVTSLNSPESALPGSVSSCDNATLVATTTAAYDCVWGGGQTSDVLVVSATSVYSVTITDPSTGCSIAASSNVTIQASPVVDLGPDQTICANAGVILNAQNPGSTYSWTSSSGAVVSTAQTYAPPSSGVYEVSVTNNGCSASDAINIQLLPAPFIPEQTTLKYICGTTPVVLQGSPFGNNVWSSVNGFSSTSQNVSVYENGFYTVTATIAGCGVTETFELQTSPMQIEAYYLVDTDTTTNLSLKFVDLSSPAPISYLWDFGDGMFDSVPSPVHTYLVVDTFETSLTVSNGFCISTYYKTVNAKDFFIGDNSDASSLSIESFIVYPNPLTNDFTIDLSLTDYATTKMAIYDANGKLTVDFSSIEDEKQIVLTRDLSDLNPGVYYLSVQSTSLKGNVNRVAKLIKL